jgi:hypothetical protein
MFEEKINIYCENHINTQTHYMSRMQSFYYVKWVVYIVTIRF